MSEINYTKEHGAGDPRFNLLPSDVVANQTGNLQTSNTTSRDEQNGSSEERQVKKRKRELENCERKFKRLQQYYNYEYRSILNLEIQVVASGVSQDDVYTFQESQIGSSIWTVMEKSYFFAALDSLGKDNIRGISARIGSKSELEVKEYLLVLEEKTRSMISHSSKLCTLVDIPSASEISENCCALLEKAADALAAREEYEEAKIEEEKWDALWIITNNFCEEFRRRRNRFKNLKSMDEIQPFLDLFFLRNWFHLTENIFMNSCTNEEENWRNFADPGERPAIRTTALEDFYSLTINLTKKLVSATIFCTMSRHRARGTEKSKLIEVNLEDAEAAIRTLGFKRNSDKYWTQCARRCQLSIVDDSKNDMTYDEVESVMVSHAPLSSENNYDNLILPSHDPKLLNSTLLGDYDPHSNHHDSGSDLVISSDETNDDLNNNSFKKKDEETNDKSIQKQKQAAEETQDLQLDAIDMQSSHAEEKNLMEMLKLEPQFKINNEELSAIENNTTNFALNSVYRDCDWREKLEYYSEWETLDAQIRNESFASSRAQDLDTTDHKLPSDLVGETKEDLNQVTLSSNEYYNELDPEISKSNDSELTSESDDDDIASSVRSISFDETIAQLRGLAANFQPSSGDEYEN
ncbi:hypothetical protein EPUL_000245 [Erysiphe pulchra]|uniref:SANT domain-containing protein n=1 Tax=Erysiphe pulchra TaxID=225359 RepID=A0A2S4Q0V2_9PEZI|nr:hypothetical protein EPUL_000245 [Erysiphe pulchra]